MLCPGVTPDWDDVPGSHPAVHSAHGSSNYVDERAPYTWQLIEDSPPVTPSSWWRPVRCRVRVRP